MNAEGDGATGVEIGADLLEEGRRGSVKAVGRGEAGDDDHFDSAIIAAQAVGTGDLL